MTTSIPHVTVTKRPDGGGYVMNCAMCLKVTLHQVRSEADVAAHSHTLQHTRQHANPEDQVF